VKTRLIVLACAVLIAGCSVSRLRVPPIVEAKDTLYVTPPVVPGSVDSLLAPLGWPPGRFASELQKEIRFQLNRKGLATPQDSSGVLSRLELRVDHYAPADYRVVGRLTTPAGSRDIEFEKRSRAAEREDPTIDNIRLMAENLTQKVRADPNHRDAGNAAPVLMLIPF
jgi:hypothetical protein